MTFEKIKDYFHYVDKDYKLRNKYVYKTSKGIFGVSDLDILNQFFQKIKLSKDNSFLDLGSGDGRVVFLASLFSNATGVEFEKDLVKISNKHNKELNFDCNFICDDFQNIDFSKYDILFSFSDNFFTDRFIEKLNKEFIGTLYIYEGIFLPKLKKGKTIWINQIPIVSYEINK